MGTHSGLDPESSILGRFWTTDQVRGDGALDFYERVKVG